MRRTRPERSRKYLSGQDDSRYLDRAEMQAIELLAKQFKLRMLGRHDVKVVGETGAATVDAQ